MGGQHKAREFTADEVRARYLQCVNDYIHYWEHESKAPDIHSKLEGLAFSIMCVIDGANASLPKFILAPDPHPDDREYHAKREENYYPDNHHSSVVCDFSGTLHERLGDYKRE